MNNRVFQGALVVALSSVALAQPGVSAPSKPATTVVTPQPQARPTFESLVKRDAQGKIVRIPGCLDALALQRNPLIDDKARAEMAPVIAEWTSDVNQVVIDNLDFVERIDAGLFDAYDMNDPVMIKFIQQINVQLSSAGPLAARLAQKNLLPGGSGGMNMQISNDYVQSVFNEINSSPGQPGESDAARQQRNSNAVGRYFTSLADRDVYEQYRCMLRDSAPMLDKILPAVSEAGRGKAAGKAAAVKAAGDDVAKMVAVRDLLAPLSFEDRRAFLAKAVSLGAAGDVFKPAPEIPRATVTPARPGAT